MSTAIDHGAPAPPPLEAMSGPRAAYDSLDINIFVADLDLNLVYGNPRHSAP